MKRPPRSTTARLFSINMMGTFLLYGGGALLVMGCTYFWAHDHGYTAEGVRTLVFSSLIGANAGIILCQMTKGISRSSPKREVLKMGLSWMGIALSSVALLGIAVYSPADQWFLFTKLPLLDIATALLLGFGMNLIFWIIESFKVFFGRGPRV